MDKYSHIILPEQIKASIKYSPRGSGGGSPAIPNRDRRTHAENLQHLLELAHSENERIKQEMEAVSLPARTGTYLEFSGAPAHELVTKSLEDQQSGIRLLNVRTVSDENIGEQTFATVFIPHGKENKFATKLNKYANENTSKGKPKNDKLFRSIESINIALLRALWTDNVRDFPTNNMDWYEVWIRTNDSEDIANQHNAFIEVLNTLQIEYKANSILVFPERSVILIKANIEILTKLLQGSDQLAEVRSARTLTDFLFREY